MNNFNLLTIWEDVDGTSSLEIQYQNIYIFWSDMFFENSINIYQSHMVYQWIWSSEHLLFSFSKRFEKKKPKDFFYINFVITYQLDFPLFRNLNLLTASILFLGFRLLFLVVFSILWMLVTMYKAEFTLWKTFVMFAAYDT